ncbi:TlpA disulfide reductase family protein [Planctomycetota bacterium]
MSKTLKTILVIIVILIFAAILITARTKPKNDHEHEHVFIQSDQAVIDPNEIAKSAALLPPAKPKLVDVVRAARGWRATFIEWYGKDAPDFTVTDLQGNRHKLSGYRGKNVMLVFWATWCAPCREEIPSLIALQNVVGKDKLAILGISYIQPNNTTAMIERFMKRYGKRINYAITPVDITTLPAPFDYVQYIPGAFFIDPAGRIKLATSGVIPLHDMQLILQAE